MTKGNFFAVNRSIFSHWLFVEAPAWVFKLWLYLIGNAAWAETSVSRWGTSIPVKRGQRVVTVTELASLLQVTKAKEHPTKQMVSYWLKRMQVEEMISTEYITKKTLRINRS